MAILEVIGIASILPFMQVAAQPESIQNNTWLNWIYTQLGFQSTREMLIFTGIAVLVLLTLSNIFKAFTSWLQQKFSWDVAHDLGTRLLRVYLAKPYGYFLTHNTTELLTNLIVEAGRVTTGILLPLCELISQITVCLLIFCLLIVANPTVALSMAAILGVAYGMVYFTRKNYLTRLGEERVITNRRKFLHLKEMLTGIKTFRVYGVENFFYRRFESTSRRHSHIQPRVHLVGILPRYVLEIFAFGGVVLVILIWILRGQSLQGILPLLSLYVLAGYRLLPALQRVFTAAIKVRHTMPAIDVIEADLRSDASFFEEKNIDHAIPTFSHNLILENVSFHYDETRQNILSDLSVNIPKGKTVAFVGSTGSGKTTLVDLMVGLLHPQMGKICIDDAVLDTKNAMTWQSQIAYVPQEVFLFDDSILRNVAIGEDTANVNWERLKYAMTTANIHHFVEKELPQKYNTLIGEQGVRLSGGQRQRLGLARALYREPKVLILDEATSALDSITESAVIDSLKAHAENLTIIVIAHRLSTVRHADCIYLLEKGRIIAEGNYEKLIQKSEVFREMVELG